MMFEKAMIQIGGLGGRQPPHDVRETDDSIRGAMLQERVR